MYRVYVGNVDSEVTDEYLLEFLRKRGISPTGFVLKRGYAFVDCSDSAVFNKTIEEVNGSILMGSVLQVEASAISKRMRTKCIDISNLPRQTTNTELLELVSHYGVVQRIELIEDNLVEDGTLAASVEFESWLIACQAFDDLNDKDFDGKTLKVVLHTEAGISKENSASDTSSHRVTNHIPLRILVPSDVIGAVIGRKGQTVRNITANTKARIDVHGKEAKGMLEKMISMTGPLDCCSAACREIMNLVSQEATSANRGDVTLRMLIDDRYCGRVIGRDGKTVKKIREETGTRISISNVQEMASIYPDRVIAIRGNIDSMSRAENIISAKLRECYERDMVSVYRPSNTMASIATSSYSARSCDRCYSPPKATGPVGDETVARQDADCGNPPIKVPATVGHRETCQICIPNYAVGAIIGSAGSNIKRIIRDSNAFVTVEPRREDQSPSDERVITIKGSSDACWRASYFIFEKMKTEGFAGADGDVRLRSVIHIPQSSAGRVVGRSGKNVRDVQRSTGAVITLAANGTRRTPSEEESETKLTGRSYPSQSSGEGDVAVEVLGNFIATQGAYSRIRSIVYKAPSSTGVQLPLGADL